MYLFNDTRIIKEPVLDDILHIFDIAGVRMRVHVCVYMCIVLDMKT